MSSLWKWRADDLDTIFKVINQGLMKKPYWVEYHDTYEDGTPVWNGGKSVFWNLMEQAYPEEWRQMMRRMMTKMEELGGLQKGTHQEKLMAFFDRYYFSVIDDFSSMLYNEDGRNYEQMKLAMLQGRYTNDTDPLGQSLGNAASPERAWVKKRIQYMMSKYSFGDYDATTADGSITVRTSAQADGSSNSIVLRLTPALKLYPTIGYGTTAIRGARTEAGEVCEITVDINGTSDQQLSIKSADWLLDIGDWSGYVINGALSIIGKRLKRLKLGDADSSNVKLLISSLTLGNTVSLTEIDVQNIATLSGSLDMRTNYRLRSFLGKGTRLTEAHFADGGALEKVEYPASAGYIELKNLDNLTNDNCDISDCKGNVMSYFVSGCDKLQPIKKLTEILDAQQGQPNHALRYVRCVGFNETFSDGTMFDKLVRLVDGTYQGIDAEGQYGNDQYPVLDGTINLTTGAYRDTYDALMTHYPKLKLNIAKWWIRFEDPEVKRICVENWDKDGDGELSLEEAAAVSSIGTVFMDNERIVSFTELERFSNFKKDNFGLFRNCRNLKTIRLPEGVCVCHTMFAGCLRLESLIFPNTITPSRTTLYSAFEGCVSLRVLDFPPSFTGVVTSNTFANISADLIFRADSVVRYTPYANWILMYKGHSIYVPDHLVQDYKEAAGWREKADCIKPLSAYHG